MQIYNYRKKTGYINTVNEKIDLLSEQQAKQVSEFIDTVREKTSQEQIEQSINWFNSAILPILKEFAEMTCSILSVEKEDTQIFVATLKNNNEIDITESSKPLQMIINLANHVNINSKNDEITLSLVFDCADFINIR